MGDAGFSGSQDETPQRIVTLRPYAISKREITVAEYRRFLQESHKQVPGKFSASRDKYPVTGVSWEEAYLYTRWLTEQTGQKYRLPTEAEWEMAARGGQMENQYWWGPSPESGRAHCRLGCESPFETRSAAPVGSFAPNAYSLYDTAGNAAEWTEDCWHGSYIDAPLDGRAWLAGGDCTLRVVRGGSYESPISSLRSTKRDKLPPDSRNDAVGFRIVRETS